MPSEVGNTDVCGTTATTYKLLDHNARIVNELPIS